MFTKVTAAQNPNVIALFNHSLSIGKQVNDLTTLLKAVKKDSVPEETHLLIGRYSIIALALYHQGYPPSTNLLLKVLKNCTNSQSRKMIVELIALLAYSRQEKKMQDKAPLFSSFQLNEQASFIIGAARFAIDEGYAIPHFQKPENTTPKGREILLTALAEIIPEFISRDRTVSLDIEQWIIQNLSSRSLPVLSAAINAYCAYGKSLLEEGKEFDWTPLLVTLKLRHVMDKEKMNLLGETVHRISSMISSMKKPELFPAEPFMQAVYKIAWPENPKKAMVGLIPILLFCSTEQQNQALLNILKTRFGDRSKPYDAFSRLIEGKENMVSELIHTTIQHTNPQNIEAISFSLQFALRILIEKANASNKQNTPFPLEDCEQIIQIIKSPFIRFVEPELDELIGLINFPSIFTIQKSLEEALIKASEEKSDLLVLCLRKRLSILYQQFAQLEENIQIGDSIRKHFTDLEHEFNTLKMSWAIARNLSSPAFSQLKLSELSSMMGFVKGT